MEQTQTETQQYRIHWHNWTTGTTGHFTGTYAEAEAKVWVAALNRDESNIKQGLTHWTEAVKQ